MILVLLAAEEEAEGREMAVQILHHDLQTTPGTRKMEKKDLTIQVRIQLRRDRATWQCAREGEAE